MPQFRQYPQATSLLPTDAFILDRLGQGSMFIEEGALQAALGVITPYAAQMTLTEDKVWSGQIAPATYWIPWDSLVTNSAPTPAYNPDGVASLTVPVPAGCPAPGPTFPGFVIPETGIYQVYSYINMTYTGTGPFQASFETFIEIGGTPWPGDGGVLNSNERPGALSNASPGTFVSCNVSGGVACTKGDVLFTGIVDNTTNDGADLTVTALSYFGIYRVR